MSAEPVSPMLDPGPDRLELLRREGRWTVARLPNSSFPAAKPWRERAQGWHRLFDEHLQAAGFAELECLLHVWKMSEPPIPELYQQRKWTWKPQLGLGVWPDRPAPAPWTQQTFMDAGAAILEGTEMPMSSYRLLHLQGSLDERRSAGEELLGNGCSTRFWSAMPFATLAAETKKLLLPGIAARQFQREAFYLPLLSHNTALSASADQLASLLCGAAGYAQESPDAGGLLFVSAVPLPDRWLQATLPAAHPVS